MRKISDNKMWFMVLLLVVSMTGCSSSDDNAGGTGGGSKDTTAPTVRSTIPVNHATNVALNHTINAIFSEAMSAATITATTFTVTQGTTTVPGTVTYFGTTATFKPASDLASGAVYTATITTGAKDLAGNALAAHKVWSFTTGTTTDTTPPTVDSTVPDNLDTGVALNSTVNAIFSEAMSAATLTPGSFTVTHATTTVSGTVTYLGTMATFKPASNLASGTTYTATITTAATDLAGIALLANKVWSFTTGTTTAAGPAPVLLGSAANYVILAETGVSTVPSSTVTGNIGVSPYDHTALTGWTLLGNASTDQSFTSAQVVAPFKLYAADNQPPTPDNLTTAVLNMGAAYTDAAGRAPTSAATTNVGSGTLTGLTLAPGVYQWGSAVHITGDITLTGSATDVWIFQISGTLDMDSGKHIVMAGALPQNVFWQVADVVTIGTGAHIEGIIMGQTMIALQTGASIKGRLLAQSAVTLDMATVTQP